MMDPTEAFHEPARDRLLGPLLAPAGRALARRLPAVALPLASLAAAGGALAALLAGMNVLGGVGILLAAALDAAGAAASKMDEGAASRNGFGAVLDGVADHYADTLILAGMAAWSHAHEDYPAPLAVGFAALIGAVGLSYATARTRASAGIEPAAVLFGWTGRDARLLIAAAGALAGQAYWALAALAVLANLPVAWVLLRLPRYLRD